MKNHILLTTCLTLLILISGFRESKVKTRSQPHGHWIRLTCGLYLSPDGVLGFASRPEIANIPNTQLKSEECANVFITHIGSEGRLSLKSVVDTNTFESLGANFYRDKSNIYNHYEMCDRGYLNIFSEDTSSFKVLGSCYAVHHSKVYHFRSGLIDADPVSFKTSNDLGQLAKDKYGFFAFGERISEEQLIQDAGQEMYRRLKNL